MTPLPSKVFNGTFSPQTPFSTTAAGDTITNVVFGILACIIGIITIWQAHRAWQIWHPHTSHINRSARRSSTTVGIQIGSTSTLHGTVSSPTNIGDNHLTENEENTENNINRANTQSPVDGATNGFSGGRIAELPA